MHYPARGVLVVGCVGHGHPSESTPAPNLGELAPSISGASCNQQTICCTRHSSAIWCFINLWPWLHILHYSLFIPSRFSKRVKDQIWGVFVREPQYLLTPANLSVSKWKILALYNHNTLNYIIIYNQKNTECLHPYINTIIDVNFSKPDGQKVYRFSIR